MNKKDAVESENIALAGSNKKTDFAKYNGTKSNSTLTVDSKKRYSQNREMPYDQKYTKTDVWAEGTDTDDNDIQTDSVCENPYGYSERSTSDFVTDTSSSASQTKHEKLGVGVLDSPEESPNTVSLKRKTLTIDKKFDASGVKMTSSPQKGNIDSIPDSFLWLIGNLNRCWQWLDNSGVWIDYPDYVNDEINHRLQQRPNASVVVKYREQR